jgi:hypothetical protein
MKRITRDMTIEDLVDLKIEAVGYLADRDIQCIACGEPIWETIEEAAGKKGFSDAEIDGIIRDLNAL